MTIIRHYIMIAAEGRRDELVGALRELGRALAAIAGSEGFELMGDTARPERLLFIERWTSIEAHQAGGGDLPKPVLEAVMALLAGRPDGAYFSPL